MSLLQSWPALGLLVAMVTVLYVCWPSKLMKKNEYVMFFLISLSTYWLIMLICHICMGGFHQTDATSIFLLFLALWMSITHFLYPFKHTKRNQQFTFLVTAFAILEILLIAGVWILVQFSNM